MTPKQARQLLIKGAKAAPSLLTVKRDTLLLALEADKWTEPEPPPAPAAAADSPTEIPIDGKGSDAPPRSDV
jgi:hypothetical protein